MKSHLQASVFMLMSAISFAAMADQNTAVITVQVTIYTPPCEVNNNQVIDVDFGDNIITTDVAAGMIEKPVNYTIDCSSADTSKQLKMTISGMGADFDDTVLKTSIPELGVKIKANGSDYPVNTDLNFGTANSKPVLTALLVQQPGTRLPTGGFSASANMRVDYQ